ncbi:hypothetical protein [Nocardia sp. NPDC004415]
MTTYPGATDYIVEHEHFRVGVTVHPFAILRAPDRSVAYSAFVDDLTTLFAG